MFLIPDCALARISRFWWFLALATYAGVAWSQGGGPANVVTAKVGERVINPTVTVVGSVNFGRTAQVSSEISGIVEAIPIETAQSVRRGDLLARINSEFFAKDIDITRGEMQEVEVQLAKQRSILKRREALIRNNATSQDAYDEAFYTVQELERRLETLRQRVERLRLSIRKSEVRAPFDGVVLDKHREVGEAVGAQTAVATIASTRDVEVTVAISQDLLRFQKIGSEVKVIIEALGAELTGKVLRVDPIADLRSKNVRLKIVIPYRPQLIQNLTARLEIPAGVRREVLVVKRDAVVRMQGEDFVYTVDQGKSKILPVEVVARMGEEVAVDSPQIVVGMPVVVEGNQRLRPDQAVTVVND